MKHQSVLLAECIDLLAIRPDGIYVDGTLGRGGHSEKILERLTGGKLYVFDLDEQAIKESKERLKNYSNVIYIHDNFMNMNKYLTKVDGILLDLGVSSPQFDEAERGFSYRFDGPLDMRMDKTAKLTAYEIVNHYSEAELYRIFRDYGEERYASSIAKKIVAKRELQPISTTFDLVAIIKESKPARELAKKGHPAKQCFQALRIEVNQELTSLASFLESLDNLLNVNGRVAIISFHSLEDRIVKQSFKKLSAVDDDKRIALRPEEVAKPRYQLLVHKPLLPSEEEIADNPRAKSAKLRGLMKVRN